MPTVFQNREFALILSSVIEGRGFNRTYYFSNSSYSDELTAELKSPSVESFIRASTTGNSVKCLAVYLNLTNACQTLDDVSKVKAQVPKIALVTLVNESTCTLQELAGNVQNAGYSVLIYFAASYAIATVKNSKNKVFIPVAIEDMADQLTDSWYSTLSNADLTYVDIFAYATYTDELTKPKSYLKRLYFWFLIGPLITLEWMRRTRKFCWMSDSQDDQREAEERTTESERNASENEIRTMEEGENETEESRQLLPPNYQGSSVNQRSCEEQPLLDVEYTRQPRRIGRVKSLKKFIYKGVLCFCYLILIIAALPIAISSGGYSFFRFDNRNSGEISFLFDLIYKWYRFPDTDFYGSVFSLIVLLWSPIQIFCFLLYSRLACTSTWVVPINVLKLIRSDWFASNIFLLVLAVVVPLCTQTYNFGFFACYNAVCTMCTLLFVIILNKHKFVTRYAFYISVCMIFAYLESSIVALFYFVLNSEGSLNNLKLTALRTVAIGLTLKVSFSSSMHIIRKLNKPVESLFEGLSET